MKRLDCPGSGAIPDGPGPDDIWGYCPTCGLLYKTRDDGGVRRHPMRYAKMLAYLSDVVRFERERAHGQTLRWSDGRCVA